MKTKFLSIVLILGIMLNLFSVIPTSAETIFVRGLPFAFFDFEDDALSMASGTIVNKGMGESTKCMEYTESGTMYSDRLIQSGNGDALTGKVVSGNKLTVSFYLKLAQKLTPGKLLLLISYTDAYDTTSNYYADASFDGENITDWQKIEFTYTPDSDITVNSIYLRFGHHGTVTNHVVDGSPSQARTYYIDDMMISSALPNWGVKKQEENPKESTNKLDSIDDYLLDFEEGSSLTQYVNGIGQTSADKTEVNINDNKMQLVSDPDNNKNTVLKVTLKGTEKDFGLVFRSITGSGNGASLATGTVPAGKRLVYTFKYRFAQDMNSINGPYNSINYYPEFCINNTGGGFAKSVKPIETEKDIWYTATLSYTNNTASDQSITQAQFRFCGANDDGHANYRLLVADGHTGFNENDSSVDLGERVIYLDDFASKIENAPVGDKLSSLNDYSLNFESGSSMVQTYISPVGWTAADKGLTTIGQNSMQLVADPENENNTVLKVTMGTTEKEFGMYFRTIVGSGNGANFATGKIPLGKKIVYTFKYRFGQDMNAVNGPYNTVDYYPEFCVNNSGGGFAKTVGTIGTKKDTWYTAKLAYINTSSSEQSITQAQLRFCGANDDGHANYRLLVADGHTGFNENDSSVDLGERVIYLDKFKISVMDESEEPEEEPEEENENEENEEEEENEKKEPEKGETPASLNIYGVGEFTEGQAITFNHTFLASINGTTDKSFIRLMHTTPEGVTASLSSSAIDSSFVVPKIPENGTFVFEVIPLDEIGVLGDITQYRYAQVVGQEVKLELSDFDEKGNISAIATIDNQRFDGNDINAVLIVEMLNEKGAVVKFAQMPLVCKNGKLLAGDDATLTLTTDNENPLLSKVTKATALIWDCDDADIPSITNTTMQELISDVSVVK